MACLCVCSRETASDLFVEELVEVTGLQIPDLLWGATPEDLTGINPLAVYYYDWKEYPRDDLPFEVENGIAPTIDLGVFGIFVGKRRNAEEIDVFELIEAIADKVG